MPRERYRAAYEPGCSIGVLTRLLADRCDTLVASDFIPAAVAKAREQVADLPHVRVDELVTPREWPVGTFDLIVVSELAYFLQPDEVRELGRLIGGSIEAGGSVVMVHWLGPIDAWPALPTFVVGITLVAFGATRREGLVALGAVVVGLVLSLFAKVRPEGTYLAPKQ